MTVALETVRDLIRTGNYPKASDALDTIERTNGKQADVLFLRGLIQEFNFEREPALKTYETVLESDPDHEEAAFRAALLCDQGGDDESAMDLYERCVARDRARLHAVMNLAVLYEENGQLRKAEACLRSVLDEYPTHARAWQFLKSVQSSFAMVYDERGQREREQRDAVLDMPVTDFELSVRSRNCLRQMGIRSLGDLVRTNELQLLTYKNFGETSLNEIKALLTQKGLRLGQAVQPAAPPPPPPAPPPPEDGNLHLHRPVSELELSVRSRKCLQRLGIATIGELVQRSAAELMSIKNFGQTSLTEIERQLTQVGLSLRKPHDPW